MRHIVYYGRKFQILSLCKFFKENESLLGHEQAGLSELVGLLFASRICDIFHICLDGQTDNLAVTVEGGGCYGSVCTLKGPLPVLGAEKIWGKDGTWEHSAGSRTEGEDELKQPQMWS